METMIKVIIPEKGTRICESQTLLPGVHVGNSIIKSENGIAWIGVVNTSMKPVEIGELKIESNPIYDYSCYTDNSNHNLTQSEIKSNTTEGDFETLTGCNVFDNDVDATDKKTVKWILDTFMGVFLLPGEKLTHTTADTFKLPLYPDANIVNQKQYRIPEAHKAEVQKQIKKLLEDGIIEPSISPYNSPLLLVPKKSLGGSDEKKFRLCIDYRKINKISKPYQFPLPRIDEIIDKLGKAKYFSSLDMSQGYHQVLIDEADREKNSI